MKAVKLGICGLGTVGSGTFNVLTRNAAAIAARAGRPIEISHIGARRDNPNADTGAVKVSRDIFDVVNDAEIDVVVELIGGTTVAKDLVLQAIANGKHVVTANKALIAEFGNEIFTEAEAKGVTVAFEAAVAGGIPIIKALKEGLAANQIQWLAGIINGTGNFILTEMRDKNRDFADVLKEAQDLGYAEADPTFDVEGIDAAHKLVILSAIAFGTPLCFDGVFTEGITQISQDDVKYAEELGYRIKHLGIAKADDNGIEMRVHPTLIPESRLVANVDGVMNAVLVQGDAVGPTMYYGPGAGAEPTASAVIADIVDLARSIDCEAGERVSHLGRAANAISELPIKPITDVQSAYYLRMKVFDKTGVLANITRILSAKGISVEGVIQKQPSKGQDWVKLIMISSSCIESTMLAAIAEIEALDTVDGGVSKIRVETLG